MTRDVAHEIMLGFADRTGLTAEDRPPTRYLWTDAFAVCNFVGRFFDRGDEQSLRLALRLVDQTHHVLGRHRPDDPRTGWISGLPDAEGEAHPTRGGLRIGKPQPERRRGEPLDQTLEWDRDGQYFHYLTRWMHALDRVAQASGDSRYHRFACELAQTACARFMIGAADGSRHLLWKMSIDLSRPQVASEGQHDPLDGFLMCCELQASSKGAEGLDLGPEIRLLAALCRNRSWDTSDALGLGGLLCDAHRSAQLARSRVPIEPRMLETILGSSLRGLRTLESHGAFDGPAERRLAFRELGLSIGLHAVQRLTKSGFDAGRLSSWIDELARYQPLAEHIERFWLEPASRESRTWREHRDINDVMLATSLAPEGYLGVGEARSA
jgi:hypothetical protein